MADERKKSIVIFEDYEHTIWQALTDEEVGAIVRGLIAYAKDGELRRFEDRAVQMAYMRMIADEENNAKKWETRKAKAKEAAERRWKEKNGGGDENGGCGKSGELSTENAKVCERIAEHSQAMLNDAKRCFNVNVNGNVNENVNAKANVNVNVNENVNVNANANVKGEHSQASSNVQKAMEILMKGKGFN